jgi:hypothetical protein
MLISNALQIFNSATKNHQIKHFRANFKEKWPPYGTGIEILIPNHSQVCAARFEITVQCP